MGFTKKDFFDMACGWGYDHLTTSVDDDAFLPAVREKGASDRDIEQFKRELERTGKIKNHEVIGGMRDFQIDRTEFRQYLRRVLPATTLKKAQALYDERSRRGAFNATTFVESVGVSEKEAIYLLDVVKK